MSRSKKKTKIQGITTAVSEKENKQKANRKVRRMVNQNIKDEKYVLPQRREISDIWNFDKDGKIYRLEMKDKELRK